MAGEASRTVGAMTEDGPDEPGVRRRYVDRLKAEGATSLHEHPPFFLLSFVVPRLALSLRPE
jgi:hypothetical protein